MSLRAPDRPTEAWFPDGDEYLTLLDRRTRRGTIAKFGFLGLLVIAVLALASLLLTIVDDSFGLVAVVNEKEPEAVVRDLGYDPARVTLDSLSKEDLVTALSGAINRNVGRRLEREQRFFEDRLAFESQETWDELCASDDPVPGCTRGARSQGDVLLLVKERVVVPDIIASNGFFPSVFDGDGFRERVREAFETSPQRFGDYTVDQVRFQWRAWLNMEFLTSPSSSIPELAGIRTAILGSAWLILFAVLFAVPVGVGAAIYLEEFARKNRINDFIQTNINNLAGVPSIIYGMLGLAVFVRLFEPFTSGSLFGAEGAGSGRTVLSAGLTLGLLTLPVVIISSQEAIRAVPNSLRQAGMALGATRWQTVRSHVLPVAIPGILTGAILAIARAIGETAPLLLVGAAGFITADPSGPFSKFTALPIQIFQWTSLPQEEFRNLAAAASLALLVMLLALNAVAVILRNRYSRRLSS
ncbi:MAG: phosphate ABC transporter permease PstA [Acidimicrobiia bacterium]|nr:phosphate ABC transporter permease PstA [Acidimicrobiia bacterium]